MDFLFSKKSILSSLILLWHLTWLCHKKNGDKIMQSSNVVRYFFIDCQTLGVKIVMKKSCRNVVGFQFQFDFKNKLKSLCVAAFPYFLCTHITVEKFYQFKLSYGKSLWAKAIWLLTQFELPSVWGDTIVEFAIKQNYLLLNIEFIV